VKLCGGQRQGHELIECAEKGSRWQTRSILWGFNGARIEGRSRQTPFACLIKGIDGFRIEFAFLYNMVGRIVVL
jgi:hypothetical protein